MNRPTDPQSRFIGAPSLQPHHPTATPARVVEVAPAPVAHRPLLTISQSERQTEATLSVALVAAIPGLKHGSLVLLVVPTMRGGTWYLDTRPKPGQGRRLPSNPAAGYRFTLPRISATHFLRQRPVAGAARPRFENERVSRLTFALGPERMEEVCVVDGDNHRRLCETRGTGYYELLPVYSA